MATSTPKSVQFLALEARLAEPDVSWESKDWRSNPVALINRFLDTRGTFLMPGKAQKGWVQRDWQNTHFVGLKLSASDREQFTQWWSANSVDVEELLNIATMSGLKLSQSFDKNNQCAIFSATCVDPDDSNYNACVTSRGRDWLEAAGITLFKINVMLADVPWHDVTTGNNWG